MQVNKQGKPLEKALHFLGKFFEQQFNRDMPSILFVQRQAVKGIATYKSRDVKDGKISTEYERKAPDDQRNGDMSDQHQTKYYQQRKRSIDHAEITDRRLSFIGVSVCRRGRLAVHAQVARHPVCDRRPRSDFGLLQRKSAGVHFGDHLDPSIKRCRSSSFRRLFTRSSI